MSRAIGALVIARKPRIEIAVQILMEEYVDRLDSDSFQKAVELVEIENKAIVFVALRGRQRDIWLEKQAGAVF